MKLNLVLLAVLLVGSQLACVAVLVGLWVVGIIVVSQISELIPMSRFTVLAIYVSTLTLCWSESMTWPGVVN